MGQSESAGYTGLEIAIVGMAGRFPGAQDLETFWDNLRSGVESVRRLSDEELREAGVPPELLAHPDYVRAASTLDRFDRFDAPFFGISAREAEIMDPQHRLFLETVWSALEDAGYDPAQFSGLVGVYGGSNLSGYLANVLADPQTAASVSYLQLLLGNDKDYLSTRVSYRLDLEGPSLTVQTACSTSLVAVHLACQALLSGECDMAVAGGVSVRVPHAAGYVYMPGEIYSPDGHTRTFDADGQGTLFGSGVGAVVLKRLSDAQEEGDRVLAVIRGSAINNDGALKVGYTAPRARGQARVIQAALEMAEVEPESLGYVEAHGTGTPLGDPIEMEALQQVFGAREQDSADGEEEQGRDPVWIGSVKSNLGHLESAAGVAGLIKTVLALRRGELPPSLNFRRPNPEIPFDRLPFRVLTEGRPWERNGSPRRAGVSSFGIGGTNAHVVLEEAPPAAPAAPGRRVHPFVLSARTEAALEQATERLAAALVADWAEPGDEPASAADVAFTLQVGRRAFEHRRLVVGERLEEVAERLTLEPGGGRHPSVRTARVEKDVRRRLAFLFPGQGSQYPDMGRGLYEGEEVFRREVDRCAEVLRPEIGVDLLSVLYPAAADRESAAHRLRQTDLTQPALFAVEYALARLWMSWGLEPAAMIGHSVGEYVAACLAGVFSLEHALRLVAFRGRLMQRLPQGAMVAVPLGEDELLPLLPEEVSIAALNAPGRSVASGPEAAMVELEERLRQQGVDGRRLHTSHAFHSPMMEPIAESFRQRVAAVPRNAPERPFASNLSGRWITDEEAVDPSYWARHLRRAVRFVDGVGQILEDPELVLLEVGPGRSLSTLAARHPRWSKQRSAVPSLPSPREAAADRVSGDRSASDEAFLMGALGRLWLAGVEIPWRRVHGDGLRRRVGLPTYPFEPHRYWLGDGGASLAAARRQEPSATSKTGAAEEVSWSPAAGQESLELTTTEEQLLGLWHHVLGGEEIGLQDHFFESGGDSLLATQLVSRLRRAFEVEVPLETIFEAPTPQALARRVDALREAAPESSAPPLAPLPREEGTGEGAGYPLSFSQLRLWILDQLEPESSAYHIPGIFSLDGPLDVAALEAALAAVVERHEPLRTRFQASEGFHASEGFQAPDNAEPVQIVDAAGTSLPVVDLSRLGGDRSPELRRLLARETAAPFDLAAGGLLRTRLLRLAPEEHVLASTLHHIVGDRWSYRVLIADVAAVYGARREDREAELEPLPVQYADYAAWQRQWLRGEVLEAELDHWRQRLAGAPPCLELPTDRPRPAEQSFRGAGFETRWPLALQEAVQALARRRRASSFMVLLAAFQGLVHRFSGQRDLPVGTPIAGRDRLELEPLIGFFVNTLVIRTEVAGGDSFDRLLERVRRHTLDAYAHQALPFDRLVDALEVPRDLSYNPVFQVLFDLQNVPPARLEVSELAMRSLEAEGQSSQVDLGLSLRETEDGLHGTWSYAVDLFDRTTVVRLAASLERFLTAAAGEPERAVGELPLLAGSEAHQMTMEWNDTAADLLPALERGGHENALFLHRQLSRLAQARPEAPAVIASVAGESRTWSYGEVEVRANRLAWVLRNRGVGPETPVGICLERSLDLVVAIFAVLKAGGAYVPLDPGYPRERLEFMVQDAGLALLLITSELAPRLRPEGESSEEVPALLLDDPDGTLQDELGAQPATPPADHLRPSNLAYIIYTSGSTGRPKGAMNSHRAVTNRIAWMQRELGLTAEDRVLQKTPFSFDVSVWEFLWPLSQGAALVMAEPGRHGDPEYLAQTIAGEGVTVLHFVPSMLQAFLAFPEARRCTGLRLVVSSGEALSAELRDRCHRLLPAELHNLYGPTEAAIDVTHEPCRRGSREPSVAIGRPIANVTTHILDRGGRPVPLGVAGQLHLGGVQLARGYLGRPRLTAEKFVPAGIPGEPEGGRLYATGDLARWLPDGRIQYLGRIDHQVKLRGFRIELGEIAAALEALPSVAEAVALVREDHPGDRRLVAYFVAAEGAADEDMDGARLRAELERTLPAYMVPALLVPLASLPTTPNGKLDRRALPAPSWQAAREGELEAPTSAAEQTLAEIWSQVLRVPAVGAGDNFFTLGGDSILAIQAVARANAAGLRLSPRQIFQHQTVAELAAVAGSAVEIVAEQGPVEGEAPLTPIQHWFFELAPEDPHHWNQSLLFAAREPVDAAALAAAARRLVEHHDALRLRFRRQDGGWVQDFGELPVAEDVYRCVDLSALPLEELETARSWAAAEAQASFDLETGPLFRVVLLRGPQENEEDLGGADRVLLVAHHLVVDGVSWRILLEDLETLYRSYLAQGPSPAEAPALPPKTTSFRTWAERQQRWAEGEEVRSEAALWLEDLETGEEARDSARLPLDHAVPSGGNSAANRVELARRVSLELDEEITAGVLQELPEALRCGVEEALLGALVLAVESWSGTGGLWVDLEGHGREELSDDLDLTRTVGWFTTRYPVHLTGGDPSAPRHRRLDRVLRRVKERLRRLPRRGLGYGALRYLADEEQRRALAAIPRPPVVFNYLGQLDGTLGEASLLVPVAEDQGPERSPRGRRGELLEVNASVVAGRLRMEWIYSSGLHRQETVAAVAGECLEHLRELVTELQVLQGSGLQSSGLQSTGIQSSGLRGLGLAPSDFPLAGLDRAGLEIVADQLPSTQRPDAGQTVSELAALAEVEDLYPLSPLQESLLALVLASSGTSVGFEQSTVTLPGSLDAELFARTWQTVVDRHPILRTAFFTDGLSRPLQGVYRQVQVPVEHLDWSHLPAAEQRVALSRYLEADRRRGFSPGTPPLLRLAVIRLGAAHTELVWSHHHLLLDAWCRPLVLEEVFSVYEQLAADAAGNTTADLALPPRRPYRDYIAWLEAQDGEEAREYWRRRLDGAPRGSELALPKFEDSPAQAPQGGVSQDASKERSRSLPASLLEALDDRARGWGVTLGTLFQGAWTLLLARYGDRRRVLYGATVSGRPAELTGVDAMIGMFINNLPVVAAVDDGAAPGAWLQGLQQQLAELRQFEHCALPQVQEWCGLPAGRRLFDTLFLFQNVPGASSSAGAEQSFRLETNYPLTLAVWADGEPRLVAYYQPRRYDDTAVARLLGHLERLLEELAEDSVATVGELELLTPAERHQLAVETAEAPALVDGAGRRVPYGVLGRLVSDGSKESPEADEFPRARLYPVPHASALRLVGPPAPLAASLDLRLWAAEVEAELRRFSEVEQAAVAVDASEDGEEPALTAYLLLSGEVSERNGRLRELRRRLRRNRPDLGAPPPLVAVASWPVAEGEELRGALQQLAPVSGSAAGSAATPQDDPAENDLESQLQAICHELLGETPALGDDLFELGAQSLTVMQLIARIRALMGVELPLSSLFEEPTVGALATGLRQLEAGRDESQPPLVPVPRGDGDLPLSFAQQRLWLAQQMDPESPAYNEPRALRLRGALDPRVLERALDEIVRRHESLRTVFPKSDGIDGGPVQRVLEHRPVRLATVDLRSDDPAAAEAEAQELARREALRPFGLAVGPLLRVSLVRLEDERWMVLFTLHHIVTDGWSMDVLIQEMSALYDAFLRGLPSPLEPLAIQYPDYAVWQRRWLQGAVLEEHLDYWHRRLGGDLPRLELPREKTLQGPRTQLGGRVPFRLDEATSRALEEVGQQVRATPFMTLLAALGVLFQRHTGQTDLLLGTEVANRTRREIEPLIGFFVNILALRTDLSGNPTFLEALERVRETCLGAFAHAELPFDRLVQEIQPERNVATTGLVRAVLVLENAYSQDLELGDLHIEEQELADETCKFDLLLVVYKTPGGYAGHWTYSRDLFDPEAAEALAEEYEHLLAAVAAEPGNRLRKLALTKTPRIPTHQDTGGSPEPETSRGRDKTMTKTRRRASKRKSLADFKPQSVSVSAQELVRMEPFSDDGGPLVVQPDSDGVDLRSWAGSHRRELEDKLLEHGSVLFRGFQLGGKEGFRQVCLELCPELYGEYGDLPQGGDEERIYESTPYPPDKRILYHNESSQLHTWPLKQFFYCVQPARAQGETPIVDGREVYRRLDPAIREKFARLQLLYVRNFTHNLDVPWQVFFRTGNKAAVEEYCRKAGIDFEWTDDDGLRTRTVCPAVARHPRTGEEVFFNQIQAHHIACMDPEVRTSLLEIFTPESLPRNVYYGDGSPIEDEVVEELVRLYDELAVAFPWQEEDLLMVDNMLTAHSRNPYEGPRQILVAMGEMVGPEEVRLEATGS